MFILNRHFAFGCASALLLASASAFADTQQWSAEKANSWYGRQRWLVGSNYIPADAINQLEMWQAQTFNPAQIDHTRRASLRSGITMFSMLTASPTGRRR